jgi:hypothetical protein
MEPIVVRPEKEQGAMWFIAWAISFVLGLALCWGLLRTVDKLIFDLCLVGWLILMSLILLWILAFYKSLEYVIDSDSIKMRKGVFWRKSVTVPYTKITNIDVTQGPLQRVFNIGTIHIQTAGASGPRGAEAELKLLGVRDLEGLKDTIMARIRGYTISGTSDSQIFRHMLKELTAIREVLEKRQS